MKYQRVDRIGKRILDVGASTIQLINRTNNTTIKLSPESLERWLKYFGKKRG